MSVHASCLAWSLDLDPAAKLVLLFLADHAIFDGTVEGVSVAALARQTSHSEEDLLRTLGRLERLGFVARLRRHTNERVVFAVDCVLPFAAEEDLQ